MILGREKMNTREEFEKWMCDNYYYTSLLTEVDRELAFKAWQEQQKKIDELRMECEDTALRKLSAEQQVERLEKKIKGFEADEELKTLWMPYY